MIQARQLSNGLRSGQPLWLVDVRTPAEFLEGHLEGAYNHPLSALGHQPLCSPQDRSGPLLLICQNGLRSRQAAERLLLAGQAQICLLEGGLEAWTAAGLALTRPQPAQAWLEDLLEQMTGLFRRDARRAS